MRCCASSASAACRRRWAGWRSSATGTRRFRSASSRCCPSRGWRSPRRATQSWIGRRSVLDLETVVRALDFLAGQGITVVTFSSEPALADRHDAHLVLATGGSWSFEPLHRERDRVSAAGPSASPVRRASRSTSTLYAVARRARTRWGSSRGAEARRRGLMAVPQLRADTSRRGPSGISTRSTGGASNSANDGIHQTGRPPRGGRS